MKEEEISVLITKSRIMDIRTKSQHIERFSIHRTQRGKERLFYKDFVYDDELRDIISVENFAREQKWNAQQVFDMFYDETFGTPKLEDKPKH